MEDARVANLLRQFGAEATRIQAHYALRIFVGSVEDVLKEVGGGDVLGRRLTCYSRPDWWRT